MTLARSFVTRAISRNASHSLERVSKVYQSPIIHTIRDVHDTRPSAPSRSLPPSRQVHFPHTRPVVSSVVKRNRVALSKPDFTPQRDGASEFEWLHEDDTFDDSESLEPSSSNRHDWRLRAPSRVKLPHTAKRNKRRRLPPQTLITPDDPFYDAVQRYQNRFLSLLAAEQAEDEAALTKRLSTWSPTRLQEEGFCLTSMSAFWLQANQFGRPVAAFQLGPGLILPQHKFENGTQVLISRLDPLLETPLLGSVVSASPSQIKISFPPQPDAQPSTLAEGDWRLDVGRTGIVFERMRAAISHLHRDPQALISADSRGINDGGRGSETILQGTHLRDILLRTFYFKSDDSTDVQQQKYQHESLQSPDAVAYPLAALNHPPTVQNGYEHMGAFRDDMRIQSWARRYAEVNPVVIEGDPIMDEGINDTQRRAMAMMVGQRASLVQGPPGTGKTKTIIETIKLLKVHFEVPHPILVATYTNVAVDNLVDGLVFAGVKALRVGYGGRSKSSLAEHTLDFKLEQHPLQPDLKELTNKDEDLEKRVGDLMVRLADVREKITKGTGTRSGLAMEEKERRMLGALIGLEKQQKGVRSKLYALQQQMLRDVISDADVICTTCLSSACVALNVTDFPVVFLDEASMSTEPASLIPLMKGSEQVALIGDHKQLPPVITSPEAQAQGLATSLFERLTEEGVVPSIMLDVQYRMHPAISRFPSSEFYNLSLRDGTVDDIGNVAPDLMPPASQHLNPDATTGSRPSVIFLNHAGSESARERSRVNVNEAYIVASVVEDLLLRNPRLRGQDIGIIAPYVAQISLLTRLFNTDAKYRARFKEVLGDHRAMQIPLIEIKTVDGFEGREKDVIIFSTVRNNPGGYIGFLADRRRLNVGLTRAKRGLFVVGSMSTLQTGKSSISSRQGDATISRVGKGAESWRRYAKFLKEHGLVVNLSDVGLSQALFGNLIAARDDASNNVSGDATLSGARRLKG